MNNVARACFLGCTVLVAIILFVACWPVAPVGGGLQDAATSEGGEESDSESPVDSTIRVDAATDAEAGEAGGGDGSSPMDDGEDSADVTVPTPPYPSASIAEGIGFGCSINSRGNVLCWGDNTFGQTGSPLSSAIVTPPQQVPVVANATAIALGDYHACAVTAADTVYCWGLNDSYQLGYDGTAQDAGDQNCSGHLPCNPTPALIGVPAARAIAAAGSWTCIVATDKSVDCWGAVQDGTQASTACGAGTCEPPPYPISGVGGVAQLAVGFDHSCAVLQGNALSCWGNNDEDELGSSEFCSTACAPTPLDASAASVAAGTSFSCTIVPDGGAVTCFGDNTYGELGHVPGGPGAPANNDVTNPDGTLYNGFPWPVAGLEPASVLVASGTQAACALVTGGTVECWGNITSDAATGVPVAISGLPTMTSLGVPDDNYACGAAADGGIWCWYLVNDGGGPLQVQ